MEEDMNLADAMIGEEYIVKEIQTEDEELISFLFSLGYGNNKSVGNYLD